MDKTLSNKLKFLSFFLMILVVFIHSENLLVKFSTGNIMAQKLSMNSFIQNFFSNGICRIAVPLFFIISGYLFFLKIEYSFSGFFRKYKSRFYSLFVPYIIWSSYGIALYFILQLFPFTKIYFTHYINQYSLSDFVKTLFIYPLTHQLWFIQDLMIIVLISPIIYLLIKYLNLFSLLVFFLLWYNDLIMFNQCIFFFSLGAFFSITKRTIDSKRFEKFSIVTFFLWIVILIIKTILLVNNIIDEFWDSMILKTSLILGVFSIWFLYDLFFKNTDFSLMRMGSLFSFSFIIYVFHEPLLTIIKKALFHFMGFSELSSLLIYFLAPILSIIISILVGINLLKRTPKLYKILTGNR